MSRKNPSAEPAQNGASEKPKPVTLKAVAQHLGLSTATVSLVLNRSPVADSIPRETHERVFAAARELKYRPNYMARSLRRQRSFSIGVLVPEISEGYAAGVMHGIEAHLLREGYFYLVASHRLSGDILNEYVGLLEQRSVEGFIMVAAPLETSPLLPTVAVAGHREMGGVTNVVLDHDQAIRLAMDHLVELGHERVAFFKGHPNSSDTEARWDAIQRTAGDLGLAVRPELCVQLSGEPSGEIFSPEEGYREGYAFGRKLLGQTRDFTALFAFNDISAIGAIRAFLDAGLRVPEDVSVIGFDDIEVASFHNPSLTTVRQPLFEMGELASRTLLARIAGVDAPAPFHTVEAELVVRDSTAPPRA
ncbi:MAG: LacI family DNA-binding transcriptional regulator [Acidobacteriota bacterium]